MVTVCIYIEGGGDAAELKAACREAFTAFFRKSGLTNRMPKVVACGSRNDAFDKFRTAVKAANRKFVNLLLVDSEAPVASGSDVWSHLQQRDGWDRPEGVEDDSAHLMVQCMEAWFLADRATLTAYFGNGFNASKLPAIAEVNGVRDIEAIAKAQIFESLKQATRETKTKGRYDKGEHSFQILAKLDAGKLTAASPHAAGLIQAIKSRSS